MLSAPIVKSSTLVVYVPEVVTGVSSFKINSKVPPE